MPTFKNIRIKKRGGGTRLQRVKVLASGKYQFVKNLTSKASKGAKTTRNKGKSVSKRMARQITIPVALLAGASAGMIGPAIEIKNGDLSHGVRHLLENYSGVYVNDDGSVSFTDKWKHGLVPLIIGGIVHKYVGGRPLNVNAALGRAGVPFIRI